MFSNSTSLPLCLVAAACFSSVSRGAVVGLLDVGGNVDISNELGTFSSTAMQSLITSTGNLDFAGVLDAEGSFGSGNFSNDSGVLATKITGASRYGRDDGTAAKASGSRWGFVNGGPETWTPDAGLTHFGLITTPSAAGNLLTVGVTYSDASTDSVTASALNSASWIGFHNPGETITSIQVSEVAGGPFANYDDVSLVFIPEPSSVVLLATGLFGFLRRRKRA